MPEPLISILESRPYLGPLHTLASEFISVGLVFGPTDRDGSEKRHVLCIQHCDVHTRELLPKRPLLFDVIGQICDEDCFFTADGIPHMDPADEPVASCWLEPRPHMISDINWRGVPGSIGEVVEHISGTVDTSRLLAVGENGEPKLQVIWQGNPGESAATLLPMYDAHGQHYVPRSLDEVPFGEAVHAVFTLEYYYNRAEGRRILFASLLRMHLA